MKSATARKSEPSRQSIEALQDQSQRCLQAQDLAGAERYSAEVLASDPENVTALNRMGVVAAMRGRLDDAVASFEKALVIDPHSSDARQNLDKVTAVLGTQKAAPDSLTESLRTLTELAERAKNDRELTAHVMTEAIALGTRLAAANRRECIDAVRLALKLQPTQLMGQVNLNNYLLYFGEKAVLADFAKDLTPAQLGTHLLVACFPKSGSTLLKRLLCEATGYPEAQFCSAFLQNEQEIYLPSVINGARTNLVIQQHCRATVPNLHILQALNIRPVVLVRNIFDVLLSWKEFLDGGAHINTFFPHYQDLSDEQRIALVVDDRAPWYLSFFAGWQHAEKSGQIGATWMTYEQLTADPEAALEGILEFYGVKADPVRLARATQMVNRNTGTTRFNKGKTGRGHTAFSEGQIEQIRRLAGYYPGVDFSLIGL